MTRNKIIDIALIGLLYIAVCTFPIGLITKVYIFYFLFESLLLLAMLLFIILFVRTRAYLKPDERRIDYKTLFLFIPVVVVAISNFFYAWIFKEPVYPVFEWANLLEVLSIALLVIIEELIFRYLLIGNMERGKPIVRIVIAAGIFGLCHLTHFFSSFNPVDLIIVVYTFGLGMLFGIIYYYTRCLIACIGLHFLFNFCNDFLFARLYSVSDALWYYLINGFVALAIGIYVLVLYLVKLRKNPAELG